MARIVAEKMSEALGQQIVIDNRGGAGGTLGTRAVAKRARRLHHRCSPIPATIAIAPSLYPNVGYDPRKDFAPIGLIGAAPSVVVVHPSLPPRSIADLIKLAKETPATISTARRASARSIT